MLSKNSSVLDKLHCNCRCHLWNVFHNECWTGLLSLKHTKCQFLKQSLMLHSSYTVWHTWDGLKSVRTQTQWLCKSFCPCCMIVVVYACMNAGYIFYCLVWMRMCFISIVQQKKLVLPVFVVLECNNAYCMNSTFLYCVLPSFQHPSFKPVWFGKAHYSSSVVIYRSRWNAWFCNLLFMFLKIYQTNILSYKRDF